MGKLGLIVIVFSLAINAVFQIFLPPRRVELAVSLLLQGVKTLIVQQSKQHRLKCILPICQCPVQPCSQCFFTHAFCHNGENGHRAVCICFFRIVRDCGAVNLQLIDGASQKGYLSIGINTLEPHHFCRLI